MKKERARVKFREKMEKKKTRRSKIRLPEKKGRKTHYNRFTLRCSYFFIE